MVVDLIQAVDIGNYFSHLHVKPAKNSTDTLLGKYKDTVNLSQEMSLIEFLQSSRSQRYERNLYFVHHTIR